MLSSTDESCTQAIPLTDQTQRIDNVVPSLPCRCAILFNTLKSDYPPSNWIVNIMSRDSGDVTIQHTILDREIRRGLNECTLISLTGRWSVTVVWYSLRHMGTKTDNVYGVGTGQIWLSNLECTGTESDIDNCTHAGWGVHSCKHHDDVAVFCTTGRFTYLVKLFIMCHLQCNGQLLSSSSRQASIATRTVTTQGRRV